MIKKNFKKKPKILIFVLAYNAEKTISETINRLPLNSKDDASSDNTFIKAKNSKIKNNSNLKITILRNPVNQGYGGNVKIGFMYAIKNNFDFIALTHADGQYPPEEIPKQLKLLLNYKYDVIFGSRMMKGFNALKGGMPIYKFIGNKATTWVENKLIGTNLSEFHTGHQIYSVKILKKIPFFLN